MAAHVQIAAFDLVGRFPAEPADATTITARASVPVMVEIEGPTAVSIGVSFDVAVEVQAAGQPHALSPSVWIESAAHAGDALSEVDHATTASPTAGQAVVMHLIVRLDDINDNTTWRNLLWTRGGTPGVDGYGWMIYTSMNFDEIHLSGYGVTPGGQDVGWSIPQADFAGEWLAFKLEWTVGTGAEMFWAPYNGGLDVGDYDWRSLGYRSAFTMVPPVAPAFTALHLMTNVDTPTGLARATGWFDGTPVFDFAPALDWGDWLHSSVWEWGAVTSFTRDTGLGVGFDVADEIADSVAIAVDVTAAVSDSVAVAFDVVAEVAESVNVNFDTETQIRLYPDHLEISGAWYDYVWAVDAGTAGGVDRFGAIKTRFAQWDNDATTYLFFDMNAASAGDNVQIATLANGNLAVLVHKLDNTYYNVNVARPPDMIDGEWLWIGWELEEVGADLTVRIYTGGSGDTPAWVLRHTQTITNHTGDYGASGIYVGGDVDFDFKHVYLGAGSDLAGARYADYEVSRDYSGLVGEGPDTVVGSDGHTYDTWATAVFEGQPLAFDVATEVRGIPGAAIVDSLMADPDCVLFIDPARGSYSGGQVPEDLSPVGRTDGVLGLTAGTEDSDPHVIAPGGGRVHWRGDKFVFATGLTGNYIQRIASPLTGLVSFEAMVRIELSELDEWNYLCGTNSTHVRFGINGSSRISIAVLNDALAEIGGNGIVSDDIINSVGKRIWLRGKLTLSSALCEYWLSFDDTNDPDEVTWTSIGSGVGTNPGTTPRLDATTYRTWLTSTTGSNVGLDYGAFYAGRMIFDDGSTQHVEELIVPEAEFTPDHSQIIGADGTVWTVARSGGQPLLLVDRPTIGFGDLRHIWFPDSSDWDVPLGVDKTIVAAFRSYDVLGWSRIIATTDDATDRWGLRVNGGGIAGRVEGIANSGVGNAYTAVEPSDHDSQGVPTVASLAVDRATNRATVRANGHIGSLSGTLAAIEPSNGITIGGFERTSSFLRGQLWFVAVFDRLLTETELEALEAYYGATGAPVLLDVAESVPEDVIVVYDVAEAVATSVDVDFAVEELVSVSTLVDVAFDVADEVADSVDVDFAVEEQVEVSSAVDVLYEVAAAVTDSVAIDYDVAESVAYQRAFVQTFTAGNGTAVANSGLPAQPTGDIEVIYDGAFQWDGDGAWRALCVAYETLKGGFGMELTGEGLLCIYRDTSIAPFYQEIYSAVPLSDYLAPCAQAKVRLRLDVDNGAGGSVYTLDVSSDGGVTWQAVPMQNGGVVTTAVAPTARQAIPWEVSSYLATADVATARVYGLVVKSGIDGTPVLDWDVERDGLVDSTGYTWTLRGTATLESPTGADVGFDVADEVADSVDVAFALGDEVADSVSVAFDVADDVAASVGVTFDVGDEVATSAPVAFDVAVPAADDVAVAFDVGDEIADSVAVPFDVADEVAASEDVALTVAQAVTASIEVAYDLASVAADSADVAFDVALEVAASEDVVYDVASGAELDVAVGFDVAVTAADAVDVLFEVVQQVGSSVDVLYEVEALSVVDTRVDVLVDVAGEIATDIDVLVDVAGHVTDSADVTFDVAEPVSASVTVDFELAAGVGDMVELSFDVAGGVSDSVDVLYEVESIVEAQSNVPVTFEVAAEVATSAAVGVDVAVTVQDSQDVAYDVSVAAGASEQVSFDVAEAVTDSVDVLYQVEVSTTVSSSAAVSYDVAVEVADAAAVSYDVAVAAAETVGVAFDVAQAVAGAVDVFYELGGAINVTVPVSFDLEAHVSSAVDISFELDAQIGKAVPVAFHVAVVAAADVDVLYVIDPSTGAITTGTIDIELGYQGTITVLVVCEEMYA